MQGTNTALVLTKNEGGAKIKSAVCRLQTAENAAIDGGDEIPKLIFNESRVFCSRFALLRSKGETRQQRLPSDWQTKPSATGAQRIDSTDAAAP
jgi:hypothetical protein